MSYKLHPFWWFKKPPSPACWRNSCEDCNDWTLPSGLVCAIDTVDYKEGSGSVEITASPAIPTANKNAYISVGTCDKYFGFWLNPSMPNQNAWTSLRWLKANGDYIGLRVTNLSYAPIGRWLYGELDVGGNSSMGALQQFIDNTWYWIEIYYAGPPAASTYYWYVNGVNKWNYSTAPEFGDPATFRLYAYSGHYLGTQKLDFIRRATKLEYPPT